MRTFSGFTWEWIVETALGICDSLQQQQEPASLPEGTRRFLERAQGLIEIVPKLRQHPQVGQWVPKMYLLTLSWFPAPGYEIALACEEKSVSYRINILKNDVATGRVEVMEQKIVAFDEVADEVYAYITRFNDE
ncbi:MAG: hypothetical protein KC547_18315 [Anaerolineae bacterium]|nr:hypothetical protein [Anaerolineae bacterium]